MKPCIKVNLLFSKNVDCQTLQKWRDSKGIQEVVYVTTGNPVFCLALYLTVVHFQGELQHVGYVGGQKKQALTNQNSRNRWCQIARGII